MTSIVTQGLGGTAADFLLLGFAVGEAVAVVSVPPALPDPSARDWKQMVLASYGPAWGKPDPGYEFSNGRKFDDRGGYE